MISIAVMDTVQAHQDQQQLLQVQVDLCLLESPVFTMSPRGIRHQRDILKHIKGLPREIRQRGHTIKPPPVLASPLHGIGQGIDTGLQ